MPFNGLTFYDDVQLICCAIGHIIMASIVSITSSRLAINLSISQHRSYWAAQIRSFYLEANWICWGRSGVKWFNVRRRLVYFTSITRHEWNIKHVQAIKNLLIFVVRDSDAIEIPDHIHLQPTSFYSHSWFNAGTLYRINNLWNR